MEREAYERVVMEQKDRIFAYASMMLRNATEAQDVAQEVLIRLWKHRDRVETERAPHWLRRAAHNLCIDQMRRRRVRNEAPVASLCDWPKNIPATVQFAEVVSIALYVGR